MPISAGEVDATIRIKILQEKMEEAQANLRNLQEQFRAAGGAATTAGADIQKSMVLAQANINALAMQMNQAQQQAQAWATQQAAASAQAAATVAAAGQAAGAAANATTQAATAGTAATTAMNNARTAAAATATAMGGVAAATGQASAALGQMDALATRMIERLLIFYALKSTFDFTVGLFQAADAMVQLSEKSGVSVELINEWERAAARADVPTKDIAKGIEQLAEKLSQIRPETVDSLHKLGLTLNEIFEVGQDERFRMIAEGLSKITSTLERQQVAIGLGLGDVDAFLKKYAELTKQVKDSANVDEDHIKVLSDTVRMYKDLGVTVSEWASKFIYSSQKAVEDGLTPFFAYAAGGWQAYNIAAEEALARQTKFQRDIFLPKDIPRPPSAPGDTPLFGQDWIDNLRKQIEEITPEMMTMLDELRLIGELNEKNAAKIGVTTEQLKAYNMFVRESAEAERERIARLKELDAELMTTFRIRSQILQIQERESSGNYGDRGKIELLRQLEESERALAKSTFEQLNSEKDRTRVLEEYGKIHERIAAQILKLEKDITAEINNQIIAELKAREANMARAGVNLQGGNIDESPFAIMQRRLEALFLEFEAYGKPILERQQQIINEFLDAEKKATQGTNEFGDATKKGAEDLRRLNKAVEDTSFRLNEFSLGASPLHPLTGTHPLGTINMNVSGVWDPGTVKSMADTLGTEILRRTGRKFGSA
jgi:hypothetical protein